MAPPAKKNDADLAAEEVGVTCQATVRNTLAADSLELRQARPEKQAYVFGVRLSRPCMN